MVRQSWWSGDRVRLTVDDAKRLVRAAVDERQHQAHEADLEQLKPWADGGQP